MASHGMKASKRENDVAQKLFIIEGTCMEEFNFRKSLENYFKKDDQGEEYYDLVLDDELTEYSNHLLENVNHLPSLYRYSSADYWNIRSFETGKLRLSPIGILNDITEGIPFDDEFESLSFSQVEALGRIAYIKSFSENQNDLLMWSHYADKHAGICIKYELAREDFKENIISNKAMEHLFPVVYSNKRCINNSVKYMANDLKTLEHDETFGENSSDYNWLRDCASIFLMKGREWEYEKEWRVIVSRLFMFEEDIFADEFIPFDYAVTIYLGARINPEVKQNILEIADRKKETQNREIAVFQMDLSPGKFQLVERKLK